MNPSDVDLAADLTIDIDDVIIFSSAWLSHNGPSNDWNGACDISNPPDGIIDLADLMFFSNNWLVDIPEPEEFINPADINEDRIIDLMDFRVFSAAWLSDDSPTANWNPACDIAEPNDGVVDFNDLTVLISNWLVELPDPNQFIDVPDINQDGIVDLVDYSVFSAAWLSDDQPPVNWNPVCDIMVSGDGKINGLDFAVLAAHWQFTIPDPNQFKYIPGGEFEMGNHDDDFMLDADIHPVQVDSFYMGKYPITKQQYCEYLNASTTAGDLKVVDGIVYDADDSENQYPYFDSNSVSEHSWIEYAGGVFTVIDNADHPIVQVSWYGSVVYCNWLSQLQGRQSCYDLSTWQCDFTKSGYRLATEAEWEYAARGGEYNPYYRYFWGDEIDLSKVNYYVDEGDINPYPTTTPVGYYDGNQIPEGVDMANGYGLYDMAGNVLEWCNDWYDANYYNVSPVDNPTGPEVGTTRVLRGGSWNNPAKYCLTAARVKEHTPVERSGCYGFRIVLAPLPMP